jgi:hypothetical protein
MIVRRWLQLRLISLLTAITVIAFCLAVGPEIFAWWSVRSLTNEEVHVDGNFALMVSVTPRCRDRVKLAGTRAYPHLLRALTDPKRFAAAHVTLENLINPSVLNVSSTRWNGLYVSLHANGSIDFHPEQIDHLVAHWNARLCERRFVAESHGP